MLEVHRPLFRILLITNSTICTIVHTNYQNKAFDRISTVILFKLKFTGTRVLVQQNPSTRVLWYHSLLNSVTCILLAIINNANKKVLVMLNLELQGPVPVLSIRMRLEILIRFTLVEFKKFSELSEFRVVLNFDK
jgi:hypothetical protein